MELQELMGSQLHAVHDLVAGQEGRENTVTGYMETIRSATKSVLAMRLENTIRDKP
jgi:hypothetical protein